VDHKGAFQKISAIKRHVRRGTWRVKQIVKRHRLEGDAALLFFNLDKGVSISRSAVAS